MLSQKENLVLRVEVNRWLFVNYLTYIGQGSFRSLINLSFAQTYIKVLHMPPIICEPSYKKAYVLPGRPK